MELCIKRGFNKSTIIHNGEPVFIIKNARIFGTEKIICHNDGSCAYSVRRDPKPLDNRDKYIFTDQDSKNEFYAWVNKDISHGKNLPFYKYFLLKPINLCIEAESFFGELYLEHIGFGKFNILINGKKCGFMTKHMINCSEIDDLGLLAVLYVFSGYILSGEEYYRVVN